MATAAELAQALATEPLEVSGRLVDSSNHAMLARLEVAGQPYQVVYKPLAGERPLWDFPDGELGRREVAAYLLSSSLGWQQVPLTVWREDGPMGPGMCQLWVDGDSPEPFIELFTPDSVPADWIKVLQGFDGSGCPVVLAHADSIELQRLAVFDYLANNADRKAGHLIVTRQGRVPRLWAIDHGLTFHVEPKLRTVLWGFADRELPAAIKDSLGLLTAEFETFAAAASEQLDDLSIEWVRKRAERLIEEGTFPTPQAEGPAVPWPIF